MLTKAPKGTKDVVPQDMPKWNFIENTIKEHCKLYGFSEIRTPVFEHTELFLRGVGETTDVVQKEMYTFLDKGERSITLRPEITASSVRAYLENNLFTSPAPTKLFYIGPCYRYEKPQSGRLREFHQFGIECFGSTDPALDAEIISLAYSLLNKFNVENVSLQLNSIGCPDCRNKYNNILKEYLSNVYDNLCDTCKSRFEKNPMRIFDCKSPVCQDAIKDAPLLFDNICDDCGNHFEQVTQYLKKLNIEYDINKKIVRGLDYYTKTVFEFVSGNIGSQSTICGGGRYDGLVSQIGGSDTPGIGFALGIERFILTLQNQGYEFPTADITDIYIANIGDNAKIYVSGLCEKFRSIGISCEMDYMGRSLKAQMKFADKLGAKYTACIGDEEIGKDELKLKNMKNGEIKTIKISEISNYTKEGFICG